MSIFLTAYDTLAGSGHAKKLDQLKYTLEQVLIDGQYVVDENNSDIYRLYAKDRTDIPPFEHPVLLNKKDGIKLFLDLRSFTVLDRASGDYVVRLNNEASYQINRAHLNAIWATRDPFTLLNVSPIPMVIFASWLSENIARRFAIDPREQLTLAIYTAYYYYSLFTDNDIFDEEDKNRIISSISRNLRCSALDVAEVIDRVPSVFTGVKSYCQQMETVVGSVRLRNFNESLLVQIVGGSWFGMNARELIAVALEHPPTWIALVNSSYTDRTYRNTILAKTAERKVNKAGADNFSRAVFNLITSQ